MDKRRGTAVVGGNQRAQVAIIVMQFLDRKFMNTSMLYRHMVRRVQSLVQIHSRSYYV